MTREPSFGEVLDFVRAHPHGGTLDEVAQTFEPPLSRERIRQIEARALRKLGTRVHTLGVHPNNSSAGSDASPEGPPRIDLLRGAGGASARTLDHKNQRPGQRNHSASRGAGPGHRRLLVHANSTAAFRGGNR